MQTDDLIAHLSNDLPPVRNGAVMRVLLSAITLGVIGSTAVMVLVLHPRHDLAALHRGIWHLSLLPNWPIRSSHRCRSTLPCLQAEAETETQSLCTTCLTTR